MEGLFPTILTCGSARHDVRILVLAAAISIASALAGMYLQAGALRRGDHGGRRRAAVAGGVAGLGAWATHFTAMMAFQPGMKLAYDAGGTLASMAIGVIGGAVAFSLGRRPGQGGLWLGAFGFGATAAALHYVGVTAMHAQADRTWNAAPVALSIALSLLGSWAAFCVLAPRPSRVVAAAVLLGSTVLALHLAGMGALILTPDGATVLSPHLLDRSAITTLVAGAVAVLLGVASVFVMTEARGRRVTALRTRQLADSTFEGLAFLSEGRIVQVNQAFCEMTGRPAKALRGSVFFGDVFQSESPVRDGGVEGVLRRPGADLHVEVLVRSPAGASDSIIAVRDLSERREAEAARVLLQAAIEAMPEAVAIFDRDDRLHVWNKLYGAIHPECGPLLKRGVAFRTLIEAGVNFEYYRDAEAGSDLARKWVDDRMHRHFHPTGPEIQHLVDGRYIRVEEQQIAGGGFVSICVDITELKMKEESLALLFQRTPMAIWVADPRTARIFAVNEAAMAYYGYSRDEFIGMKASNLLPPDEWAAWLDLSVNERFDYDPDRLWRHRRKDSEELLVLPFVRRLTFDGRPAVVTTAFDMTERQRAETALAIAKDEAEAANRAKSAFLANMSHEIRTPLNGVVGVADVLSRSPLADAEKGMVDLIRSSAANLERLLSDILDIARVESGQVSIDSEDFDLADAVRDVAALSNLRVRAAKVDLRIDIAPQAERLVQGDALRLKQVLTNLLSNALKFTSEGFVQLRVEAVGSDIYRFTVKDTGVGFDPAIKDRIFGRFQQADGSITRRFGGTGLGLTISRQLAGLMGGELDCGSIPGEGSEFWLTLPLPPARAKPGQQDAAMAHDAPSPEDKAEPAGLLRILVADDHPTNRKVLEMILAQSGAELTLVADGAEALAAFEAGQFELVLMDMQMPVMDGLTATSAIRRLEMEHDRRRTPIIMLTANALPEHVASALAAGADRHHSKPVTAEPLFEAISDVLTLAEARLAA